MINSAQSLADTLEMYDYAGGHTATRMKRHVSVNVCVSNSSCSAAGRSSASAAMRHSGHRSGEWPTTNQSHSRFFTFFCNLWAAVIKSAVSTLKCTTQAGQQAIGSNFATSPYGSQCWSQAPGKARTWSFGLGETRICIMFFGQCGSNECFEDPEVSITCSQRTTMPFRSCVLKDRSLNPKTG